MQHLNRRFYVTFVPALVRNVNLYSIGNVAQGVIVFPGQDYVNILNPKKTLITWQKMPVRIDCSAEEILEVAK